MAVLSVLESILEFYEEPEGHNERSNVFCFPILPVYLI